MRILISAGEASGEMYGAGLIEALRRQVSATEAASAGKSREKMAAALPATMGEKPVSTQALLGTAGGSAQTLEFFGAGGERMREAGCEIIVDAKDLAVVGITEILSHLPKILRLYRRLISTADRRRPDVAVVIDAPAFNWRVARQMKKRGIPVVYYVCPQFWAWRQGRVRLLRKYVDKALVIFPFEEQFYCERGVDATFVGHPLADLPRPSIERELYAAQYHLNPAKQWITLMPGSRRKEVGMNLPEMLAAAALLGANYEFLLPVAPTLDFAFLKELTGRHNVTLVSETLPALFHSRAGIIASGTATVEAAMMATPFVMVYRVSGLTYFLGRSRVKVPYFAMVNLIAGEEVVRELVQDDFTAANIVAQMNAILPEGAPRDTLLEGLARVKARLRAGSPEETAVHPADRAARAVMEMVGHAR